MRNIIERYLNKKKEKVIFELKISNYNKCNFYIGLVYNSKIDLYKVLYIPLDLVEGKDVGEYACYQIVDLMNVEIILGMLTLVKKYKGEYDLSNKKTNIYGISINMDLLGDKYQFKATQFVPREWDFFFDVIVTLFEYCPHIVSGLCEDILTLFKDRGEVIFYQEIFEFELLRDSDEVLKEKLDGKLLDFNKVKYLENINNKYFAIIDGCIVIVNYNKCGIVSTYCDSDNYVDYVYTVIQAIREDVIRKFSRVMVTNRDNSNLVQYYLCYGITNKGLKVISGCKEEILPIELYDDGLIKFVSDDNCFEEKLKGKKKDA